MAKEPYSIRWKLAGLLEAEGVSTYALAVQLAGRVASPTVYGYSKRPPVRPDLRVVGWLLVGLRELTGKSYRLSDLVEIELQAGAGQA